MKRQVYDYVVDESKVRLISGHKEARDNYAAFDFVAADEDESDEKAFALVAYAAMELLSQGHVVLYSAQYKQRKEAKKRLFGGYKPAKYAKEDGATRLKQYLLESGWNDGVFADREQFVMRRLLWSKYRVDRKDLFILQERLDMTLFKKTDLTYSGDGSCVGIGVSVFPDTTIRQYPSAEETIDYYRQTDDFILSFGADIILPRAYITLNKRYMSEQQLIEKLSAVAAQFDKTLEVNI